MNDNYPLPHIFFTQTYKSKILEKVTNTQNDMQKVQHEHGKMLKEVNETQESILQNLEVLKDIVEAPDGEGEMES